MTHINHRLGMLLFGTSLVAGCPITEAGEPEPSNTMALRFLPDDLGSDVLGRAPSGPPSLGLDDGTGILGIEWVGYLRAPEAAQAEAYFPSHLWLVSLESGALTPGHVASGLYRADGTLLTYGPTTLGGGGSVGWFSFVPDEPLAEGWYVLAVDLRGWEWRGVGGTAPERDGLYFARVRVGSEPTWVGTEVSCSRDAAGEPRDCAVGPLSSQPLGSLPETDFSLRIDGAEHTCIYGPIGWTCPPLADGTVFEITIESEDRMRRVDGAPFVHSLVLAARQTREATLPDFGIDVAMAVIP